MQARTRNAHEKHQSLRARGPRWMLRMRSDVTDKPRPLPDFKHQDNPGNGTKENESVWTPLLNILFYNLKRTRIMLQCLNGGMWESVVEPVVDKSRHE